MRHGLYGCMVVWLWRLRLQLRVSGPRSRLAAPRYKNTYKLKFKYLAMQDKLPSKASAILAVVG